MTRRYEKHLVDPSLHGLGDELLKKFEEAETSLLTVRTGALAGPLDTLSPLQCPSLPAQACE